MDVPKDTALSSTNSDIIVRQRHDRQQPIIIQNFEVLHRSQLKFKRKSLATANLYLSSASLSRKRMPPATGEVLASLLPDNFPISSLEQVTVSNCAHKECAPIVESESENSINSMLQQSRDNNVNCQQKRVTFADDIMSSVCTKSQIKIFQPGINHDFTTSQTTYNKNSNIRSNTEHKNTQEFENTFSVRQKLNSRKVDTLEIISQSSPPKLESQNSDKETSQQLYSSLPSDNHNLIEGLLSRDNKKWMVLCSRDFSKSSNNDDDSMTADLKIKNEHNKVTRDQIYRLGIDKNKLLTRHKMKDTLLQTKCAEAARIKCANEEICFINKARSHKNKTVRFKLSNNDSNDSHLLESGSSMWHPAQQAWDSEMIHTKSTDLNLQSQNGRTQKMETEDASTRPVPTASVSLQMNRSINEDSNRATLINVPNVFKNLQGIPTASPELPQESTPKLDSLRRTNFIPKLKNIHNLNHNEMAAAKKNTVFTESHQSIINSQEFKMSSKMGGDYEVKLISAAVNQNISENANEQSNVMFELLPVKQKSHSERYTDFLKRIYSPSGDKVCSSDSTSISDCVIRSDRTEIEHSPEMIDTTGDIESHKTVLHFNQNNVLPRPTERVRSADPVRVLKNQYVHTKRASSAVERRVDNVDYVTTAENYLIRSGRSGERTPLNKRLEMMIVQNLQAKRGNSFMDRPRSTI